MTRDNGTRPRLAATALAVHAALALTLCVFAAPATTALAQASAPARRPPTPVPTPIPTPVPPERQGMVRKGAAPAPITQRYENPNIRFSKLTRVEEVDLDKDGVFEALVEGVGTVKVLPPDIPAVGFLSRARLPFENPLLAVFKKKGNDWDLLLVAHLPMRCTQGDDPAKCDEVVAFRSVLFRYDDRPQIALQIVHAGLKRVIGGEVLLKIKLVAEDQNGGFIIDPQISYDVLQRGDNRRAVLAGQQRCLNQNAE